MNAAYRSTPTHDPNEALAARVDHYMERLRAITGKNWRPYRGTFGSFLLNSHDNDYTPSERLRKLRKILSAGTNGICPNQWIEIVDQPLDNISTEDRLWYVAAWKDETRE